MTRYYCRKCDEFIKQGYFKDYQCPKCKEHLKYIGTCGQCLNFEEFYDGIGTCVLKNKVKSDNAGCANFE